MLHYLDWYVGEVVAARAEFETALDAAGVRRWPSHANFILVEIGAQHAEFVRLMRQAECWCATVQAIRDVTGAFASRSARASRCGRLWPCTEQRRWRHCAVARMNDDAQLDCGKNATVQCSSQGVSVVRDTT